MTTPVVDPEDKPNAEKSVAGDYIVEELQVGITQDLEDCPEGDAE